MRVAEKIESKGTKINKGEVLHAWRVPPYGTTEFPAVATGGTRPEHMWLEEGNTKGGFQHIQIKHQQDYVNKGIPVGQQREKVPILAEASTTVGRHIGWATAKREKGRPVMAMYMKAGDQGAQAGQIFREAITVGANGFVVGTQPISPQKVKRKPGEPKEISDKTLQNLYFYPPNNPERRSTNDAKGSKGERLPIPIKHGTFPVRGSDC